MHLVDSPPTNTPVFGYAIQTDDGKNILIDTGFSYSSIENPQHPPGITIEMHEKDFVVNRLNSIGLRPADIDYLVCTHFDPDHDGIAKPKNTTRLQEVNFAILIIFICFLDASSTTRGFAKREILSCRKLKADCSQKLPP